MPKVRALVPLEDEEGQPIAAGAVVDASDEQATAWRAGGKVSLIEDEEAAAKAAESGVYDAVTGREETKPLDPSAKTPGPQAKDEDDDKPSSKSKK